VIFLFIKNLSDVVDDADKTNDQAEETEHKLNRTIDKVEEILRKYTGFCCPGDRSKYCVILFVFIVMVLLFIAVIYF